MATVAMVEYDDAPPEVRAVYDDIMETRKTDWINNFWKVLANDPPTLARTWEQHQAGDGARRPRPAHQGADLCRGQRHQRLRVLHPLPHRRRQAAGDDRRHAGTELMAVVGMANETNALANGYAVDVDAAFLR